MKIKENSKHILLLISCALIATSILVIGLVPFKTLWLKIVLCVVLSALFFFVTFIKIFNWAVNSKK